MEHELTILCDKNELTKVRRFVVDKLELLNIPDLEAHKLVLAVDEVCANLIIHSNNCNSEKKISIQITKKSNQLIFQLTDSGQSFDFKNYQTPSMEEIVATRRKGGLGLILVKRIMDKIEFSQENNHNICTLIKNLIE